MCVPTHMHAIIHALKHACTHTHTHKKKEEKKREQTQTHTNTHACTHAHTHARAHTHTQTHTPHGGKRVNLDPFSFYNVSCLTSLSHTYTAVRENPLFITGYPMNWHSQEAAAPE